VGRDARSVHCDIIVVDAVLAGHHRIEPFGVGVAIVDLMADRTRGLNDCRVQAGPEARLNGMSE
jgi:hypothetical protein